MERMSNEDIVIVPFGSLPCSLGTFTIKGIVADEEDFGNKMLNMGNVFTNSCGCRFESKDPTVEILEKYEISEEEYYNICERLEIVFDIPACGLCS